MLAHWPGFYSICSLRRSPFLEGRWNFEWFGDSSPGAFAARLLFEYVPVAPCLVQVITSFDLSVVKILLAFPIASVLYFIGDHLQLLHTLWDLTC